MPDNFVPVVITSGVGIGVLAAVFSGICYAISHGFQNTRNRVSASETVSSHWQCCTCGKQLVSTPANGSNSAAGGEKTKWSVCARCDGLACRAGCGSLVHGAWLCNQCQTHEDAVVSFAKQGQDCFNKILTSVQVRMAKCSAASSSSSNKKDASVPQAIQPAVEDGEEHEIVREFIERLVCGMLGTDVDDTSVTRTYGDPEYVTMFDTYHGDISAALSDLGLALHVYMANLPVSGHTPCTAYSGLKHIIRRVLRDASSMAILKEPQAEDVEVSDATSNRTYEDLLATAILNKVIDNYQHDLRRSSPGSSRRGSGSKRRRRAADSESRRQQASADDTTSISSVEEWCRSQASAGEKYVDHLSFSIQHSINEITTSEEEYSSCQYNTPPKFVGGPDREKDQNYLREDWQDNWLFSRKGKGSPKPVPVPMLVPNPATDYRALIGDRDAEDTTDLSETGSDVEEAELPQDITTILVDSRTVIGGKNLLENINPECLEPESVTSEQTEKREEESVTNDDTGFADDELSEARNNILIHDTPYEESDSLGSNIEKDMEYTEKYASMPRQISKDEGPSPSSSIKLKVTELQSEEIVTLTEDINIQEQEHHSNEENTDDIVEEPIINIRGSYSEKEKQKWRNPVALENNPYSKENLDKRLQSKTNDITGNYAFGRDYYIREAKKAAGGRKKFLDEALLNSNVEVSEHDSGQLTTENDVNIFTAVPVIVQEENDNEERESLSELQSSQSRPISLALSTDSEDQDVKRVYNLETGKVITYKNNDFTKEIIQSSKSPEGTKNIVKTNELISIDEVDSKFDENHNTTVEIIQKEPLMNISNHISALTKEKDLKETEIELISNNDTNNLISPKLKESSKKYLQSLTKNKNKLEVITNFATPPISLQENDTFTPHIYEESSAARNELNDFIGNIIEIDTEELYSPYDNSKSCIDLRFINEERKISSNNLLYPVSQNGFANSTPNLNDEKHFKDEDMENQQKSNIIDELDQLNAIPKPSVKDLKKIFDQDKPTRVTVSRSKSHITTKQELNGHRQVHSLTARSISRDYRRDILPELQKTADISTENNINGVNEEIVELSQSEEDELKAIPPCKSKIAFFELLKDNK